MIIFVSYSYVSELILVSKDLSLWQTGKMGANVCKQFISKFATFQKIKLKNSQNVKVVF